MIFQSKPIKGIRPIQYKMLKNGQIMCRVVGRGQLFTWHKSQWLPENEREGWAAKMFEDGYIAAS